MKFKLISEHKNVYTSSVKSYKNINCFKIQMCFQYYFDTSYYVNAINPNLKMKYKILMFKNEIFSKKYHDIFDVFNFGNNGFIIMLINVSDNIKKFLKNKKEK